MRRFASFSSVALACSFSFGLAALVASPAEAQVFPNSPGVSLERFTPSPGANRIMAIPTTPTMNLFDFALGLTLDWAKSPLVIPTGGNVISHQVTGQVMGALGLGRVEIGLVLPVTLYQSTDYGSSLPNLSTAAIGDLRLHAKLRLTPTDWRAGGAVEVIASAPTGRGNNFSSEEGFGFAGRLIGDIKIGPVLVAGYAGYRFRVSPVNFVNLYLSDEILAGIGADLALFHDQLDVFAETWGVFALRNNQPTTRGHETQDPVEALFGLKVHLPKGFQLAAGAGPGFTNGYGAPTLRVLGSLSWTRAAIDTDGDGIPNDRDRCPTLPEDKDGFEDEDGCPDPDNDKDGIPDAQDKCPNEPEDKDGFQDEDGCPDPDNDGDGILDKDDKCPNDAEDKDGFEDQDGCPDLDNDKDGIPDDQDKCPNEAEDRDGYRDEDGCPDPDNDRDGIIDRDDKCPNQPEDFDGFEDDDGCPEPDNDHDGFPDYKDKCPNQPETFNGFQDEDGCPEKGKGSDLIKVGENNIEIKERVFFDSNSANIQSKSNNLLNTLGLVINLHKEIKKVLIAGHSDSRGDAKKNRELSQKRAESVRKFLIEKGGVEAERLEAKGFGSDEPLLPEAKTASQHEVNRRVEFRILER